MPMISTFRVSLLIIVLSLAAFNSVLGQGVYKLDSLIQVLKNQEVDSNKIKTYDQLLDFWKVNPKLVLSQMPDAIALAQKYNNKEMELVFTIGSGKFYLELGDFDNALSFYFKAATMAEKEKDYSNLCQIYSLITSLYLNLENESKAELFADKQLPLIQQHLHNDPNALANYYYAKGRIQQMNKKYDSSRAYFEKLVNLSRKTAKETTDDAILHVNDLRLMSSIYLEEKNYPKALTYLDSCKAILDTIADQSLALKTRGTLKMDFGNFWSKEGHYSKAISYYKDAITCLNVSSASEYVMDSYEKLAEVYGKAKDYENQVWALESFYKLKDSLFTTDKKVKMTELETNYQLEKKNASLALLEANSQKQKNIQNILIFVTVLILLGLATLGVFNRRFKFKNEQLALQNEQISDQKTELQQLNAVKDKLFSVISHDLRNPISTLKTFISISKNKNFPEEKLERYRQQMEQSVNQTGAMLDNLLLWAQMQLKTSTPVLSPIDLNGAIQNVVAEVAGQANIKQVNIEFDASQRSASVFSNLAIVEIALRNLLTNAIKYSPSGSSIKIVCQSQLEKASILVKDCGVGMTEEQIANLEKQAVISSLGTQGERGSGMGIALVMQLLTQVGAQLKIKSVLNEGSEFTILLNPQPNNR